MAIDTAAPATPQTIDELIEAVVEDFQRKRGDTAFIRAKEDFFLTYGKSFPEDHFYDIRMSYFLDFFVCELQSSSGLTPAREFLNRMNQSQEIPSGNVSADKNPSLVALAHPRHSIYQVKKVVDSEMHIVDLLQKSKFRVISKAGESFKGFEKNYIFQGFLFVAGNIGYVSHGVITHPTDANRTIAKKIKAALKAGTYSASSLLQQLAHLQMRHIRHRHVKASVIYSAS